MGRGFGIHGRGGVGKGALVVRDVEVADAVCGMEADRHANRCNVPAPDPRWMRTDPVWLRFVGFLHDQRENYFVKRDMAGCDDFVSV